MKTSSWVTLSVTLPQAEKGCNINSSPNCNFLPSWQMMNTEMGTYVHAYALYILYRRIYMHLNSGKDAKEEKKPPGNRFVCLPFPYRKETRGFIVKHSEGRCCQKCHVCCVAKQIYQSRSERRPVVLARFAHGLDTLPLFKTVDQRYPLEGFSKGPIPAWIYPHKLLVPLSVFPCTAGRRSKLCAEQRMGRTHLWHSLAWRTRAWLFLALTVSSCSVGLKMSSRRWHCRVLRKTQGHTFQQRRSASPVRMEGFTVQSYVHI